MNKKLKSTITIILILIMLSILSGCINNYQVVHSFEIEDTRSIEVSSYSSNIVL